MRSLRRNSKGAVYVEFLLVFPPILLLFLFILQSAIIRATDIGVRHAASSAVRSAIVVLPDDPVAYEGHAMNTIFMDSGCSDGFVGKFRKLLETLKFQGVALPESGNCPGGPRMSAIRFAAAMRMLPFSPNPTEILPESLRGSANSFGQVGWLAGAAAYSYGATAVTFPESPKSDKQRTNLSWSDGDNVTVRVSYLAHCGIPIARFFMCDSGRALLVGKDIDLFQRGFRGHRTAQKRIDGSLPTLKSMGKAVHVPASGNTIRVRLEQ